MALPAPRRAKAPSSSPAFYEFQGVFSDTAPKTAISPLRLDLDRSELTGSFHGLFGPSSVLRYSIGRSPFLDFSARLLSGLSDGVRCDLSIGNLSAQAYAGYRGLLYKVDARSLLDESDRALYQDDKAYFAPKRAFAGLGVRAIEILAGQDFGMEGWAQIDLTGSSKPTNSFYLEPFIEGRLGRLLRWRAWGRRGIRLRRRTFRSDGRRQPGPPLLPWPVQPAPHPEPGLGERGGGPLPGIHPAEAGNDRDRERPALPGTRSQPRSTPISCLYAACP